MTVDLTKEETAALLRELDGIIEHDRYFLSPRITTLKAIRSKIRPEAVREALPPTRHYGATARQSRKTARRRALALDGRQQHDERQQHEQYPPSPFGCFADHLSARRVSRSALAS